MGVEGIEYAVGRERLEELLRSIDRPGSYCTGGRLYVPMPRVEVKGVGELSFPVPPAQIEALIAAAERAPYGKGTRTLVDTSVRDCWQIDARNVRLLGRAWPDSLAQVKELTAAGLGLPVDSLRAEPYKLLVYRKGGFFAEHRDTEKAPGMVATLTLSLPAAGSGGEVVVRHGDRETVFDLAADEPSELSFAAFYADCPHEVRPVTEGHRVSIVYNLLSLESGKSGLGAPDYADLAAPVAECLAEWRNGGSTDKIVWLLEHGYSEGGLSFETLKNTDAAVAQVLAEAADRSNCEVHAAVLKIEEYGVPEVDAGYGYWGWEDDDGADADMEEVFERREALDAWAARDGGRPALGEVLLKKAELLPSGALDEAEPDDRRLEGSTGNEGPTLEFIYRLAALVVWPTEKAVDVVAGAGIDGAVAWASARCSEKGRDDGESRRILSRLVDLWPVEKRGFGRQDRGAMLRLLTDVGAVDVATDFLQHVVIAKYDGSENEELSAALPLIPADDGWEFLVGLAVEHYGRRPGEVVRLLALAAGNADLKRDGVWRGALRESVEIALTGLEAALTELGKKCAKRAAGRRRRILTWGLDEDGRDARREPIGHEAVRDLFLLARQFELEDEAASAVRAIRKQPEIVTPDRVLPAALREMHGDGDLACSGTYAALWKQAADFLLERSSAAPSEPGDWTIAAEIPRHCADCDALRSFCRDPDRRTGRFSVRKDRRRHLHRIIDAHGLDIDHVTERRGSPYTLVCTKNGAGYRRRLLEYADDLRWMDSLRRRAPRGGVGHASRGRVARLEKAVAIGGTSGPGFSH